MDKHDLIAALKSLAGELGRTPTRAEFESRTKGGDYKIKRLFGNYAALVQAAGLETYNERRSGKPSAPERLFERELAQQVDRTSLKEKFNKEILPYVGKYDRKHSDVMTIMLRTDDHAQWVDPFCDAVFWDVAKRLQPTVINFGGDTADFYQISSFDKNPRRAMTLQSEIDFVEKHFWQKAREVCPDAQIDWVLGNHEWRLFKYLCSQSPALSSLRCLQYNSLFNLDKYKINLVARPSFLNARTGKDLENYKTYADCFTISHGTKTGAHPATKELKGTWGMSGASGHVHRETVSTWRNLYGYHKWVTNGAMCQLKSGEEYIHDLIDWTNGFQIIHIHKGRVFTEYVDLTSGFACIGGVYYFRKDYPNALILPGG